MSLIYIYTTRAITYLLWVWPHNGCPLSSSLLEGLCPTALRRSQGGLLAQACKAHLPRDVEREALPVLAPVVVPNGGGQLYRWAVSLQVEHTVTNLRLQQGNIIILYSMNCAYRYYTSIV